MKKYTYLVNFESQTLERVGESFAVKGDGGVAELEFAIPSNFGIPANQALWRVFFKLPGERESLFETLPAVAATESGDYVTAWVISKAITQKAGRLAFSLAAISGNDIQWNSRTVIMQVPESQYQPESEEAEEPYTGRLTILEGDMAQIRGEFAEVQDDFEELKETATLGTPIPESLVANMTKGHVYIYTGTEPGYTAGHVYYYVGGTLTDGGVYGGTAIDATLTQSGQAADAKVTGDEIATVKADFQEILQTTENLFDADYLLSADGWAKSNGVYTGSAINANVAYGEISSPYPISGIKANTRYYLQYDIKTDGNAGTNGNGLRLQINYTDNTYTRLVALNNNTDWVHLKAQSDVGKTIACVTIGYGSNGNNVWYLKNIILSEDDVEWIPHEVPADYVVRRNVAELSVVVDENTEFIDSLKTAISTPKMAIPVPQGFIWSDNPLIGMVKTDYNGNYDIDLDVAQYDVTGEGTTYYVDAVNGSDSNDGLSPQTALKKMSTAYNKTGCSCIMLADGIFDNGKNLNAVVITKNIAIKAMPGAKPIIAADSDSTFSVYSGNTYSASRGSCARVVDVQNRNLYGDPMEYEKEETASAVVSTPGSWALIDGVLYVHCIDNREPDRNLLLLILSNNIYAEGNPVLYLEGLTVISGYSPLKVSNTAQATKPKVYAKNCDFLYSESTNNDVVMLRGTEISIFQNCRAMYGMKDGFNYHAQNGTVPKAVEINCMGAMCGNADDSNDQGSTIHDGGSAIRINGIYFRNIGSNIADEGSESWNVGCIVYEPLAPNSGQRGNFYALTGSKMWIDSCRCFGNPHYNVLSATDKTTEIHLRNNIFDNADKDVSVYGVTPSYY